MILKHMSEWMEKKNTEWNPSNRFSDECQKSVVHCRLLLAHFYTAMAAEQNNAKPYHREAKNGSGPAQSEGVSCVDVSTRSIQVLETVGTSTK